MYLSKIVFPGENNIYYLFRTSAVTLYSNEIPLIFSFKRKKEKQTFKITFKMKLNLPLNDIPMLFFETKYIVSIYYLLFKNIQ